MKHNKKRNTAFIYEALIRHMTDSIICGDHEKRTAIIKIVTEHFKASSFLKRDLDCYRSIYEGDGKDDMNPKVITEAKISKRMIDPTGLFKAQTKIIHDINKKIGPDTFNAFVPNYKTLATISQMFSDKTTPRDKVLLEKQLLDSLACSDLKETSLRPIDNLIYKSFVEKFNSEYSGRLIEEQKNLLTKYITSFADNAVELKIYLNTEVSRLKEVVGQAMNSDLIQNDSVLVEKTQDVIKKLNCLVNTTIDEKVLRTVLSAQKLAKELSKDAN